MRTLRRNTQPMYYSTQIGQSDIYQTDDDGNVVYVNVDGIPRPVPSGIKEIYYTTPQKFFANIATSGGDAEAKEFGLSTTDYEAVIVCPRNMLPIIEGSIIWWENEIKAKYNEETEIEVKGKTYKTNAPIEKSADYRVVKRSPSLNFDKYALQAITK